MTESNSEDRSRQTALVHCGLFVDALAAGGRSSAMLALGLALAWLPVAAARAGGDEPSLDVVATWGGPVNTVHVEGDIAYLGSGRRLVILNVSDINNFTELATLDLGNTVQDIAVRDGLAFVLTRSQPNIFSVVDVSTPAAPKILWSSGSAPAWELSYARRLLLRGDYIYILESSPLSSGNVLVASIANPLNPVGPGPAIAHELVGPNDFAITGDLLYVATGDQRSAKSIQSPSLRIHDLAANPVVPPLLGALEIDLPGHSGELLFVTVVGDYAYALALYDPIDPGERFIRLIVADVSSPRAPKLVAPAVDDFTILTKHGIAAANGLLFIAAGSSLNSPNPSGPPGTGWSASEGLIIYDITKPGGDPAAPAFIRNYKTHGSIYGVEPTGDIAWLSDAGEGLIALDVTNPMSPVRKDNYHSPAFLTGLDKRDNLLFVSDLWNGFTILNVADAAAPQVLGVYQTPMTPPPFGKGEPTNNGIFNTDIAVRDNLAYLAAGHGGIHAVNVANPASPTKVGSAILPVGLRATAIELDGDFAHLGVHKGVGGLYNNYDISDTTLPSIALPLLGSVEIGQGPDTIATREGFSYLAMDNALNIVDTTAPAAPALVFESGLPMALDLVIDGDLLFVADGSSSPLGGLKTYDLAQRDAPTPLDGGFYPGATASAVSLQNQRAYAIGTFGGGAFYGCIALDATDPAQPQALAYQPNVGLHANNVILADEPHIFVATADGNQFSDKGLMVLRINGCLDSAGDADLSCDGVVNGFDLAMLLSQWTGSVFYSPCPPHIPADLSHDCRVNGGDLAILLGSWG